MMKSNMNNIFIDIEKDKKICDIQIPELRSNLTRPCSLLDPLIFDGHTNSYDHHTIHWHLMHGKFFEIKEHKFLAYASFFKHVKTEK